MLQNYAVPKCLKEGNAEIQSEINLLTLIPPERKYKVTRRIADLFSKGNHLVDNFALARCINRRLSQGDYGGTGHKDWKKQIRNRLRTLKKLCRTLNYDFKAIKTPLDGYQLVVKKAK